MPGLCCPSALRVPLVLVLHDARTRTRIGGLGGGGGGGGGGVGERTSPAVCGGVGVEQLCITSPCELGMSRMRTLHLL